MAANPYSLNSAQLGGLTSSQYVQLGQGIQAASSANPLIGLNATGAGNILDLQKGGADVLLVDSTGSSLFRPNSDSTTALQVQKAGTTTKVFTVDTSNSRIGIGNIAPAYAVDAVGSVNASVSLKVAGTDVCTSTGCTPTTGSTSYIQNQNSGAQASSNFYISGTGRATTSFTAPAFDAATGVALNVGTSLATSVNIGKATVPFTLGGAVIASVCGIPGCSLSLNGDGGGQIYLENSSIGPGIDITGYSTLSSAVRGSSNALYVRDTTASQTTPLVVLKSAATPGAGANLLQLQDSAGNVNAQFSNVGNQLQLGRIATSGTLTQGSLLLSDGTIDNYGATLNTSTLTASRTLSLPDANGTLCTTLTCAASTGSATYIQNQSSSQQASSDFWISGTGRSDTGVQTPLITTTAGTTSPTLTIASGNASGGVSGNINIDPGTFTSGLPAVNVGTSRARTVVLGNINSGTNTTINAAVLLQLQGAVATNYLVGTTTGTGTITVGQSTAANTIAIGSGAATAAQTITIGNGSTGAGTDILTIGSTNGASSTLIQGGTGNITLQTNSASASIIAKTATNSTSAFQVQNSAGTTSVLVADTVSNILTANGSIVQNAGSNASALVVNGNSTALLTVDTSAQRLTIGAVGGCTGGQGRFCVNQNASGASSNVTNASNVTTIATSGGGTNYGQRILITDTSSAIANTNNALFIDTTGTTNSSAVSNGIVVKDPTGLGGGNLLSLQGGSNSVLTASNAGLVTLGTASGLTGQLAFTNATNAFNSTITGNTAATANYTSILPAAVGVAGQCLALASVASTTQTLGYASCGGGGGSSVTLQGGTPGTADHGNLNIDGTGIFGTALSVGSIGTRSGQLYVSGSLATSATNTVSSAGSFISQIITSGRYAYVRSGTGIKTYDITNPASPQYVSSYTPGAATVGMAVHDKWLFIAESGSGAIEVVDISNPASPVFVAYFNTALSTPTDISISGNYLYIAETNGALLNQLQVIDVTNPGYLLDSGLGSSFSSTQQTNNMFVLNRYVYRTQTSNTFNIERVGSSGSIYVSGDVASGTNPKGIYAVGKYVYVANYGSNTLTIYDAGNPASPSLAGTVTTGTNPTAVVVQGRYAYVANYGSSTIGVFDVSSPTAPTSVGTIPTGTNPISLSVQGRYLYVGTYTSNTLEVFDLGGSYIQQLEAGAVSTTSLNVSGSTYVDGSSTINGGLTVNESAYIGGNAGIGGALSVGSIAAIRDANGIGFYNATNTTDLLDINATSGGINVGAVQGGNILSAYGNSNNLLYNSSFESGTYSATGSAAITLDASSPYDGQYDMQVGTSAIGDGFQITSFKSAPAAGTYVMSFYAKLSTGTMASSLFQTTVIDSSTHSQACNAGTTLSSSGYQRITCSFTVSGSNMTSLSVTQTDATARTIYTDAVQLELATTATPYAFTQVYLPGVITSPVSFYTATSSTNAFQVLDAGGVNTLLGVDTLNTQVAITGNTINATTFKFGGTGTLQTTGATNLAVDTGGGAILNLGNTNATTINVANNAIAHTIAIGTAAAVQGITIGSATTTSATTIEGGATAGTSIAIGNGATAHTIKLGTGAAIQGITIGSTTTTSATTIEGGATAGTSIAIGNGATAHTIAIGTAAAIQGITIGSTTTTSATTIEGGATAGTSIAIGNGATAHSIKLGSGAAVQGITIGSATTTSTTTIEGGATAGTSIAIGNGATAHVIAIGSGAALQQITIGSNNTTSKTVLQGGNSTTTTGKGVIVGSDVADANQVNLQLDTFNAYADTGTCSTTINQGALYYNSFTNAIRSCVNASWEDVVTTSGLGLIMFGIVPDSGATNPGDLAAAAQSVTGASGPCRVSVGAATNTLTWTSCTAYTQGRKQIIATGTATVSASLGVYQNLCVFAAGSTPTLGTANATESSAQYPAFAAGAPALCLATIKTSTTNASTVGFISDDRVFTTDVKTFATFATAPSLGGLIKNNGSAGQYTNLAAATDQIAGVAVAFSGTTSTTTPDGVIVTSGPISIRANGGSVGGIIQFSAAGGISTTVAAATTATNPYVYAGVAQNSYSGLPATNCAINTTCNGSLFTTLLIR
jgi:hypothetical protein